MKMDLLGADQPPALPYSMEQFEQDVQAFKPRIFDTYILPGFLMIYAYKSKEMRKTARRILFTSGIYMMYRNWMEYKTALGKLQAALSLAKGEQA
ncbi:MAG: hypothetical protein ACYTEQ_19855 [Planctomycetota bacterium]|jgi:hypothetical protein